MSTFLLDDIGLGLLSQLTDALESCHVMEGLGLNHSRTATTSELRDYWTHADHYNALCGEFFNHLRFAYTNRPYWPRLTISLQTDINISLELANAESLADLDYIAEKSVEAYQRYQQAGGGK